MFKNLLEGFMELVFPSKCPKCKKYMEQRGSWCDSCIRDLLLLKELSYDEKMRKNLATVLGICKYDKGLKELIHEIKYKDPKRALAYFEVFLNILDEARDFDHYDLIIPVPLHIKKLKKRGYNQVELIFKPWCEKNHYPYHDILIRTKDTKQQSLLNYEERQENLQNSFQLSFDGDVDNKNCLLVDDIFTTGSTLYHCATCLKNNGAKNVDGLVLASGNI